MDKIIRVLVLGVGGNVSQGIIKALRQIHLPIYIVGACVSPYSPGLYQCDSSFISPYADNEKFVPWLVDVCNSQAVNIIFTGVEENIAAIVEAGEDFSERTKSIFVAASGEALGIANDKYLTCRWLRENDCNYPRYSLLTDDEGCRKLIEEVGFPLLAKPRRGKGSRGIRFVNDIDELNELRGNVRYVLEEYLGDDEHEYTVGCYMDKYKKLRQVIVMRRKLGFGATIWANVEKNTLIEAEATKICQTLNTVGPLNIQFRIDKYGKPVCIEINARFSGTTAMRSRFGYRDVEAMIREYVLNWSIDDCFNYEYGEAYRYQDEFYLFTDTTKIMNEEKHLANVGVYNLK